MSTPADFYSDEITRLTVEGNLRRIPAADSPRGLIDLSSNDYLGLADSDDLRREFFDSAEWSNLALTSSASRLLAGSQSIYTRLENTLAELYGRPALLFNSGYHANTGIVAALAGAPRTLIAADRLAHASIIDGITLSRAPFTRFRHNDLAHLERILEKECHNYDRVLVITESVFSMDGDSADIEALIDLRERFPKMLLYIDEAHAIGALGRKGLGLVADSDRAGKVDITVGTFGKACASAGAFAAVSSEVKSYLVNRARSLIFSTALPPINIAWTDYIIRRIASMDDKREHLRRLGDYLHTILAPLSPHHNIEPSHIQPLVVGDPHRAVALSERLLKHGFKVLPIRVPTVPRGTDRLRVSLSAALTINDINRFGLALHESLAEK